MFRVPGYLCLEKLGIDLKLEGEPLAPGRILPYAGGSLRFAAGPRPGSVRITFADRLDESPRFESVVDQDGTYLINSDGVIRHSEHPEHLAHLLDALNIPRDCMRQVSTLSSHSITGERKALHFPEKAPSIQLIYRNREHRPMIELIEVAQGTEADDLAHSLTQLLFGIELDRTFFGALTGDLARARGWIRAHLCIGQPHPHRKSGASAMFCFEMCLRREEERCSSPGPHTCVYEMAHGDKATGIGMAFFQLVKKHGLSALLESVLNDEEMLAKLWSMGFNTQGPINEHQLAYARALEDPVQAARYIDSNYYLVAIEEPGRELPLFWLTSRWEGNHYRDEASLAQHVLKSTSLLDLTFPGPFFVSLGNADSSVRPLLEKFGAELVALLGAIVPWSRRLRSPAAHSSFARLSAQDGIIYGETVTHVGNGNHESKLTAIGLASELVAVSPGDVVQGAQPSDYFALFLTDGARGHGATNQSVVWLPDDGKERRYVALLISPQGKHGWDCKASIVAFSATRGKPIVRCEPPHNYVCATDRREVQVFYSN
jgi:hypothetical protein